MVNTLAIINGMEHTAVTVSVDVVNREIVVMNERFEEGIVLAARLKCSGARTLMAVLQTAIDELNR